MDPQQQDSFLNDVIQWDVYNWSQALPFWEEHAQIKPGMTALGIGEREGGLSLWLASKGVRVVCSDYNPFPEKTALLHKKYGVDSLISYEKQDATALTCADGQFDIVIVKSVVVLLSSKERQQKALDEFYRVLKPGGVLLLAENAEGTVFHRFMRKRFAHWSSYCRYIDLPDDLEMFSKFSRHEYKTVGFWGMVGKRGLEGVMRIADIVAKPFVPKGWRYIFIGAFKK